MPHNPLDGPASNAVTYRTFTPLEDMLAWCEDENKRAIWIKESRWWFVAPADGDKPAHIAFVEGLKADHARMAAVGTPFQPFDPEPGEAEWIGRAVAEFIKRGGEQKDLKATMARWSASKPWRRVAEAAE